MQDPVGGTVNDWVQEHQSRLHLAFKGAQDRLKDAAQRSDGRQPTTRRFGQSPWFEGQLVLLRDFSERGRHKIQVKLKSVVHRVIKAPPGEGPVYTVAQVDDLAKVKRVHRTLLKAVAGTASSGGTSASLSSPPDPPAMYESSDDDWLALVNETSPLPADQAMGEVQHASVLAPSTTVSTFVLSSFRTFGSRTPRDL